VRWAPTGLPEATNRLVDAMDRRFALQRPADPVRLPIIAQSAQLPPASPWEGAQVVVKDVGGGVSVVAFSDGTAWRRCDTLGAL
jgi:hypothetical protein